MTAAELIALIKAKQAGALAGITPGNPNFGTHAEAFMACVDAQDLIRQVLAGAAQNAKAPQAL